MAWIGFIEDHLLRFKSHEGYDSTEIPHKNLICEYVIQTRETLIVEDLLSDERFSTNPYVKCPTALRFYLGLPLICPEGIILGIICVADYQPRKLSENQISSMSVLARQLQQNLRAKKKLQENIIKEQTLVETNKMSSLGMFSMYMAHEINNSLTIIEGQTACANDEIAKQNSTPSKLLQLLNSIQNSTNRIGKIVNAIKVYSRNSKGDPLERISVKSIMEETFVLSKERCKIEGIDLKFHLAPVDSFIDCHASEIVQVLLNLINNSIDAVAPVSNKWIKAEVRILNLNVEFCVIDSGPGVPEDVAQKLMEPFFTTKDRGKGTGLGLYISKSIIEFHSGQFFFEKTSPTRFGFLLPISKT